MTVITAPAALLRLSAPLPAPRRFRLLDAAQTPTPESDRWMAGAWIEGFPPGPAYTHDPCSTGTARAKSEGGDFAQPMAGTFTVYMPAACTAQTIGPNLSEFEERLRLVFPVYESAGVERVFATGDGHSTLGAYLGDANMDSLSAGAVSPVEGLALLEQALGDIGNGLIHATPAVATTWAANYLVEPTNGQLLTRLGTRVAVGVGYIGADPAVGPAAGAGQEWAFATGPVQITSSDIIVEADDYASNFDRTTNDVAVIAERHYLINWVGRQDPSDDTQIQAGVLIDRTP